MAEEPKLSLPQHLSETYRIGHFLGEGANGKTWQAQNIYSGHQVVIKTIKINDLKSIELYKREAEVLRSIDIQGVPKLHETWISDDMSQCILIQDFIDAPSLQEPLDDIKNHPENLNQPFSENETMSIIQKVADIIYLLQTIYTPPIIHRDIKPSNILYKKSENNTTLALIDFGAVANPQKRSGGSTIAGTLGYMAPEQMVGDVSIQSDYYALGATALHLLTGIPPYEFQTDGLYKLKFEEILREKQPNISMFTIALLDILLAKDVSERPANAVELSHLINYVRTNTYKPSIFRRVFNKIRKLIRKKDSQQKELQRVKDILIKSMKTNTLMENPQTNKSKSKKAIESKKDTKFQIKVNTIRDDQNSDITDSINTIQYLQNRAASSNLQTRFSQKIRSWETCEGTIQGVTFLNPNNANESHYLENQTHPALEYTFNANGQTWCGFCTLQKSIPYASSNVPKACIVIYDPKNPRFNALFSLNPQDK